MFYRPTKLRGIFNIQRSSINVVELKIIIFRTLRNIFINFYFFQNDQELVTTNLTEAFASTPGSNTYCTDSIITYYPTIMMPKSNYSRKS